MLWALVIGISFVTKDQWNGEGLSLWALVIGLSFVTKDLRKAEGPSLWVLLIGFSFDTKLAFLAKGNVMRDSRVVRNVASSLASSFYEVSTVKTRTYPQLFLNNDYLIENAE